MSKHYIAHFKPRFESKQLTFNLKLDAVFYDTENALNKAGIKRAIQKHFKPFLTKVYDKKEEGSVILNHKQFQLLVEFNIDPKKSRAEFHYYIIHEVS